MPHNQYIHQRRRGWYVRVVVPPRLRPIVGKAHVVKSLRTRDVELARVRRWGVLAAVTEWFAEVSAAGFTPLAAHAVSPTTMASLERSTTRFGRCDRQPQVLPTAETQSTHSTESSGGSPLVKEVLKLWLAEGGFPFQAQRRLVRANRISISLPRPLKKAWIGVR